MPNMVDVNKLSERINRYAKMYSKQTENLPPWENNERNARNIIELAIRHIATAMRQEENDESET